MSVVLAFLASSLGKYIIGGVGIGVAVLLGWLRAKASGAKAEREKQAAADAAAVNSAKQVQGQVEALKPDDARAELGTWSKS